MLSSPSHTNKGGPSQKAFRRETMPTDNIPNTGNAQHVAEVTGNRTMTSLSNCPLTFEKG